LFFSIIKVVRGRKGQRRPFLPSLREGNIESIEKVILAKMETYDGADGTWNRVVP
jgi:hypothetical protein